MAYIALSIIGVLAVIAVRQRWKLKKQLVFILSVLLLGLVAYLCADLFFLESNDVISKGAGSETSIPWLEMALYFIMIVGMVAKYFYDAVGQGSKVDFQKWQFLKPILVSPIVFAAIYGGAGEDASLMLLLIFAFQNGFFWQTVLTKGLSQSRA